MLWIFWVRQCLLEAREDCQVLQMGQPAPAGLEPAASGARGRSLIHCAAGSAGDFFELALAAKRFW